MNISVGTIIPVRSKMNISVGTIIPVRSKVNISVGTIIPVRSKMNISVGIDYSSTIESEYIGRDRLFQYDRK